MRGRPVLKALLLGVAIAFVATSQARADELHRRIRAAATDPAVAEIASGQVTVTYVQTHLTGRTTSSCNSSYEFLQLPAPTTDDISACQCGIEAFEARDKQSGPYQVFQQPARFRLGAVTPTVRVSANTVQIETTSMQRGEIGLAPQAADVRARVS